MNFGKDRNSNLSSSAQGFSVDSAFNTKPVPDANTRSTGKVILEKSKDALESQVIRMKNEMGIDLSKHRARVFVAMDISGSMNLLFKNGCVQNTLTRLLPIALRFDDDGMLEVYVFNRAATKMPAMNIKNYENYVNDVLIQNGYGPNGGTNYAPAIGKVVADYRNNGSQYPAFGIFITDGENDDYRETDMEVRKSSLYRIFFQFVGIGNENFKYLKRLDNLTGRKVDNTAFCRISDLNKLTDEELFKKLLEQYPQWLRAMGIN